MVGAWLAVSGATARAADEPAKGGVPAQSLASPKQAMATIYRAMLAGDAATFERAVHAPNALQQKVRGHVARMIADR